MQQQGLPFGVAEGIAIERKAAVANALSRVRADCYLSRFVCLVYQMTHEGQAGQFAASYQELAGNPLYLGVCSPRKAQSTVEHARDLGLVEVRPGRDDSGRPTANAYRIDWSGVRRLIGAAPAAAPSEPPPAPPVEISTPCYVPSTTCYVPSTGRQVLSTTCYPHAPQPIPAGETPRAPFVRSSVVVKESDDDGRTIEPAQPPTSAAAELMTAPPQPAEWATVARMFKAAGDALFPPKTRGPGFRITREMHAVLMGCGFIALRFTPPGPDQPTAAKAVLLDACRIAATQRTRSNTLNQLKGVLGNKLGLGGLLGLARYLDPLRVPEQYLTPLAGRNWCPNGETRQTE